VKERNIFTSIEQLLNYYDVGGGMRTTERFVCDCEVFHDDAVARVRAAMPEGQSFYDLANLYKLFADNTRVQILWALSCEDLCVCDLAVLLGMTKSAISHQLKSLRLGNLVKYRKQGKVVYYSLADSHVKDIFEKGFEHIAE
jgi:ArsR family transcriptional regulator